MSEEKKLEVVEKVVEVIKPAETKINVVKLSSFRKTKMVEIKTEYGELTVEVKTLSAGDEMDSNQAATKLQNLKELTKKRAKGVKDEDIEMSNYVSIDTVKLSILRVLKGIVSWNLVGDDDKILPISEETLKLIPQVIFDKIDKAIQSCSFTPTEEELKN